MRRRRAAFGLNCLFYAALALRFDALQIGCAAEVVPVNGAIAGQFLQAPYSFEPAGA